MDISSIASILLRFVHIASAVILIGGAATAGFLARSGKVKGSLWSAGQLLPVIIAQILSGAYLFMGRMHSGPVYHGVFGLKMLLVMHIAAVMLISTKAGIDDAKRARLLTGASISGWAVILLGAVLRSI